MSIGIEAASFSNSAHAFGILGSSYSSDNLGSAYGALCYGTNTSAEGGASGGHFQAESLGAGYHIGVEGIGLSSSEDSPVIGVYGYGTNSSRGISVGGYFLTSSIGGGTGTKYGLYAQAPANAGNYAGYFYGNVRITDSLVVLGGKSTAVKTDNGEYRLLYSQESTEAWFEDFGRGRLINGKVHIELDPLFLQTVTIDDTYPMEVFIQLRDDCHGTYVTTSSTGFDVIELQGGTSSAAFSYRVVAKRKGFENMRLARMSGPTPEEVQAEQMKHQEKMKKAQINLEQDRQKLEVERARSQSEEAVPRSVVR
ncbi:MAG: hypothetical protein NT028_15430 [candidate division Zixibacteria bacterium]|nr:hypothetical protein [candidate division Zixibacteria bacterium]